MGWRWRWWCGRLLELVVRAAAGGGHSTALPSLSTATAASHVSSVGAATNANHPSLTPEAFEKRAVVKPVGVGRARDAHGLHDARTAQLLGYHGHREVLLALGRVGGRTGRKLERVGLVGEGGGKGR